MSATFEPLGKSFPRPTLASAAMPKRVRRVLDGRGAVDAMGDAAERNARLYELRVWVGDAKE